MSLTSKFRSKMGGLFSRLSSLRRVQLYHLILLWTVCILLQCEDIPIVRITPTESPAEKTPAFKTPIYLAMMVVGEAHMERFITAVKSILYYQGRVFQDTPECQLRTKVINTQKCETLAPRQSSPLNIHLITDAKSKIAISSYFSSWNLSRISLNFYDSEQLTHIPDYVPDELYHPKNYRKRRLCRKFFSESLCLWIVKKPTKRVQGSWAMAKLAWSEILPETISKVIMLDTDVLLNQNIEKLWSHFSYFNSEQMIGGVYEVTDELGRVMATPEQPIMGSGVNSGVLLLHLERMRKKNWSALWRRAVDDVAKTDKSLNYMDQRFFNIVLRDNPHFLYEISCEWNAIVTRSRVISVCPVAWVVGIANKDNCLISPKSSLRLAGIVHHGEKPFPGQLTTDSLSNRAPVKEVKYFRYRDLHTTFTEVYFAFLHMNKYCFF